MVAAAHGNFCALRRSLSLVLLGAPGSGKGTLSSRLVADFPSFAVISTGNMLRQAAQDAEQKLQLQRGTLVGDEHVGEMVRGEISKLTKNAALQKSRDLDFLFDGFPRTVPQAQLLDKLVQVDAVIALDVPIEVILERFDKRWVHRASGRTYHLEYSPPLVSGKDDVTGEPLERRDDDEDTKVIRERLRLYSNEMFPQIYEYYTHKCKSIKRANKEFVSIIKGRTSDEIYPKLVDVVFELKKNKPDD